MNQKHPLGDEDRGDSDDFAADLGEDFDGDEDFDGGDEAVLDEAVLDEAVLDEVVLDEAVLDDDSDGDDDDDDDDVPLPVDDDDDDDVHPNDVEADLEEILRDRIAASDDDEEDDEDDAGDPKSTSVVAPPRSDEWTCSQCFLIVSVTQFGSRSNPVCPSGEEPCESIKRILRG